MGINIQYNPVRKPWLKPLIEQAFRTINVKLLETIPGKTFSSILKKNKYDPKKDAIMRFSTFLDIFHRWIIDVYHYESDSRKRYIPIHLWKYSANNLPPSVIDGDDVKKLRIVMGISKTKKHRRGGVFINNLRYDSDELANYRKNYPVISKGQSEVLVKIDPIDISSVYVYIAEAKGYIQVPCVDRAGYTSGLSLQQHLINTSVLRKYIGEKVDVDNLALAKVRINERIEEEIKDVRQRLTSRNMKGVGSMARYQGVGSQSNTTIVPDKKPSIKKDDVRQERELPSNLGDANEDWDSTISGLEPF